MRFGSKNGYIAPYVSADPVSQCPSLREIFAQQQKILPVHPPFTEGGMLDHLCNRRKRAQVQIEHILVADKNKYRMNSQMIFIEPNPISRADQYQMKPVFSSHVINLYALKSVHS